MSADNPASGSGDADQPANSQPDRSPEHNTQPEQPTAPAHSSQPSSNRSRAEYAATLRNSGWDIQPQSPPASTDRSQPTPATADNSQAPPSADTTASPGGESPQAPDTTRSHDGEPTGHEQVGQPDSQHQASATDTPPPAEPQPSATRDTEPATARQSDVETPAQHPDGFGSRDSGTGKADAMSSAEAGDNGRPADKAADATTAEQPSRTDYATSLRRDDPWTTGPEPTTDRTGQPTLGDQEPADTPPADQENTLTAQDRLPIADEPTEPAADLGENLSPGLTDDLSHSDTAIARENAGLPAATGGVDTPDATDAADHQADEPTRAEPDVDLSELTWDALARGDSSISESKHLEQSDSDAHPDDQHDVTNDISISAVGSAETPITEAVTEPADASKSLDTSGHGTQSATDVPVAEADAERVDPGEHASSAEADQAEGTRVWENNPELEQAEQDLAENSKRQTGPGDAILNMSSSGRMVIENADIKDDKIYLPGGESIPVGETLKTGEAVGELPDPEKSAAAKLRDVLAEHTDDLEDSFKASGTLAWDLARPSVQVPPSIREQAAHQGIAVPDAIGAGFVAAATTAVIVSRIRDSGIVGRVISGAHSTLARSWDWMRGRL